MTARSTSKLRARVAPLSRASTAPRRRRSAAAAAVVWRWSAWSLPLLVGFMCAGNSAAALRAVGASSAAATTTGATSPTSSSADRTDPDTFTYESSWDSSPFNLQSVTENNLGLMAKACSQTYCHAGTSGLDLWVSLEEVCTPKAEPYLSTLLVDVGGGAVQRWHPLTAGVLCSLTGLASMLLGFRWGTDYSTSHKGISI